MMLNYYMTILSALNKSESISEKCCNNTEKPLDVGLENLVISAP